MRQNHENIYRKQSAVNNAIHNYTEDTVFISQVHRESMKNPSLRKTKDFLAFHEKHPELRFWQCLLAFEHESNPDVREIYIEKDGGEQVDTFYLLP